MVWRGSLAPLRGQSGPCWPLHSVGHVVLFPNAAPPPIGADQWPQSGQQLRVHLSGQGGVGGGHRWLTTHMILQLQPLGLLLHAVERGGDPGHPGPSPSGAGSPGKWPWPCPGGAGGKPGGTAGRGLPASASPSWSCSAPLSLGDGGECSGAARGPHTAQPGLASPHSPSMVRKAGGGEAGGEASPCPLVPRNP